MFSKRQINTDDYIYTVNNNMFDDDSEYNYKLYPARKRLKRLIIEDDNKEEEEEDMCHQLEQWIWEKTNNDPKIWKYRQIRGIKEQLDKNCSKLDIFYTIFDNIFWEVIVTETNRYADQVISDENR